MNGRLVMLLVSVICLQAPSYLLAGDNSPGTGTVAQNETREVQLTGEDKEAGKDTVVVLGDDMAAKKAVAKKADKAQKELSALDELIVKWKQGGTTMYFILFLSIVGLATALERVCNLRQGVIAPPELARKAAALWREKEFQKLDAMCSENKSVLARTIRAIVEHRDSVIDHIQTITGDLSSREIRLHHQRAYPLAIVATLAPLLGLFGTVIGMIGAFDTVAAVGEMGDPGALADDIAKALITTAAGLMVAIPALGFYHFFRSRTNFHAILLEEQVSGLISNWFMKGGSETARNAESAPGGIEAGSESGGAVSGGQNHAHAE